MADGTAAPVKAGRLFIGGRWLDGERTFKTFNPATDEAVAEVAEAGQGEVNLAVGAARDAFDTGPWPRLDAAERGRILWRIGARILACREELALLETLDTGRPIADTTRVDVPMSADAFFYFAGAADKVAGETIPVRGGWLNYTLREPIGVIACLTPWSHPLLSACLKIAAALAVGNTVIHKPSSLSPLTALRLAEIAQQAGLPDGVLNVLTGAGERTGSYLVRHPFVDAVAFSGDTVTGQEVARQAAGSLKRVGLALGGKSPGVVFADADLDRVASGALRGLFYQQGELCSAGSRLLVQRAIHDVLLAKLAEQAVTLLPGSPLDHRTRLGPLISADQLDKVAGYVDLGCREGATLLLGGKRANVGNLRGHFYHPTIFTDVTSRMRIARDEIGGPVLAVLPFDDEEEAANLANDSWAGLSAAVWTRDGARAHRFARRLRAGTVWINATNLADAASPRGGNKQSGYGRDGGTAALEQFTQVKSVWANLE